MKDRRHALRSAGALVAAALGAPGLALAAARAAPLVIWFTVEGAKAMRRIGERFTADTGVPVIVEAPDPVEGPTKFQQAAATGKGPDIYVYAHDRVGEWASSGLVRSVTPSKKTAGRHRPTGLERFYGARAFVGLPVCD